MHEQNEGVSENKYEQDISALQQRLQTVDAAAILDFLQAVAKQGMRNVPEERERVVDGLLDFKEQDKTAAEVVQSALDSASTSVEALKHMDSAQLSELLIEIAKDGERSVPEFEERVFDGEAVRAEESEYTEMVQSEINFYLDEWSSEEPVTADRITEALE
jgi:hypothetical protein